MKKLFAMATMMVFLFGAGCANDAPVDEGSADGEVTSGSWFLEFDLPSGWVMVPKYNENTDAHPTSKAVSRELIDVLVQSTDKPIALSGSSDLPAGSYVTEDYTYIYVLRLADGAMIPDFADDVGDGFFRLSEGVNTAYFFQSGAVIYKFVVYQQGQDPAVAEGVVKSAKEVQEN